MSLPARQQQVLDRIDRALGTADPGLAGIFATFTRLTADDGMPAVEAIRPRSRRPVVLMSVMTAAAVAGIVLGALTGTSGCIPTLGNGHVANSSTRSVMCRPAHITADR
jgi:Protein of unknown function (DUF3040)